MINLGERDIFNEINRLLEDEGMDVKITDMNELTEFLEENESENLEVYEDIRELYDQLFMGVGMW